MDISTVRKYRPDLSGLNDKELEYQIRTLCDVAYDIFKSNLSKYSFIGGKVKDSEIECYKGEVYRFIIIGCLGRGIDWSLKEIGSLIEGIKNDIRWKASDRLMDVVKRTSPTDDILCLFNDLEFDYSRLARRFPVDGEILHAHAEIKDINTYLRNKPKAVVQKKSKVKGFDEYLIYKDDNEKDRLLGIVDKYFENNKRIGKRTIYFISAMYQKSYMHIPSNWTAFRDVLINMGCDGTLQALTEANRNVNPVNPVSYENKIEPIIRTYLS